MGTSTSLFNINHSPHTALDVARPEKFHPVILLELRITEPSSKLRLFQQ